jgi:hypothetical protein
MSYRPKYHSTFVIPGQLFKEVWNRLSTTYWVRKYEWHVANLHVVIYVTARINLYEIVNFYWWNEKPMITLFPGFWITQITCVRASLTCSLLVVCRILTFLSMASRTCQMYAASLIESSAKYYLWMPFCLFVFLISWQNVLGRGERMTVCVKVKVKVSLLFIFPIWRPKSWSTVCAPVKE